MATVATRPARPTRSWPTHRALFTAAIPDEVDEQGRVLHRWGTHVMTYEADLSRYLLWQARYRPTLHQAWADLDAFAGSGRVVTAVLAARDVTTGHEPRRRPPAASAIAATHLAMSKGARSTTGRGERARINHNTPSSSSWPTPSECR